MTIYGISGLGADERVFQFLKLPYEIVPIKWIRAKNKESIESYAQRLSDQITDINFILIGVSFGGLIAIDLNKILKPRLIILISSAETRSDLRKTYRWIVKVGCIRLLPSYFFNPPKLLLYCLFGAQNKQLLRKILNDTELEFTKWAMIQLTQWKNTEKVPDIIKIHGTNDKLISFKPDNHTIPVQNGSHFMIVDKAPEISNILKEKIINILMKKLNKAQYLY